MKIFEIFSLFFITTRLLRSRRKFGCRGDRLPPFTLIAEVLIVLSKNCYHIGVSRKPAAC